MNKVVINLEGPTRFNHSQLMNKVLEAVIATTRPINGGTEVNLTIADESYMRDLCRQYNHGDQATDVLSFPVDWKKLRPLLGFNLLGDIIISAPHVVRQARAYGHSRRREWAYLFAHGTLHLLGYDHVASKTQAAEMNAIAAAAMKKIGMER